MAITRRISTYPGLRLDAPFLRAIESATSSDFDSLCRGLVTGLNQPYVIRGFNINIPTSSIPANALTLQVSDSAILHSSAAESGTILTVPPDAEDEALSPANPNVVGAFQNGVANYVGLEYVRQIDEESVDNTAGWSQSQQLEFQRVVPVARTLRYRIVISTTGFSTNLPLYIVGTTSTGNVSYITKSTPGLFRLGSGGTVPNPQAEFTYKSLVNPQTGNRREWVNTSSLTSNPVSVVPGNPAQAFGYGDWAITSLKEWMDAIMTRIREITGSAYWYVDSSTTGNAPNLFDVWYDSAGSVMTGAGSVAFNYILESGNKLFGAFQSTFTEPGLVEGDSYVVGATSGRQAVLSSFNGNQLIVNSLTGTGFLFGEPLLNRRRSAIDYAQFELDNYLDAVSRRAIYRRIATGPGAPVSISGWSYDTDTDLLQSVTITTAAPHGLTPGQLVEVTGLTGATNAPNGVAWVREVPSSTSFRYHADQPITGPATVSSAQVVTVTGAGHAYYPGVSYGWSYSGTTVTLIGSQLGQPVPFSAPVAKTGTTTNGSPTVTGLPDVDGLKVGQRVVAAGIPTDTYVRSIDGPTQVTLTKDATASGSPSISFRDVIVVTGATAATNPPNGRWDVTAVTVTGDIQFTVTTPPTGTAGVTAGARVYPDYYEMPITITGAVPGTYDVDDVVAVCNGPASFSYAIGSTSLPLQPPATGNVRFDGVVATATVLDPVRIATVTYSAPNLVVTTSTPHGLSTSALTSVTIFGDTGITGYAQTYQNVDLTVNTPTQFTIAPTGSSIPNPFPNLGTFTNTGTQPVFLRFPGNPYAGPIQWTSDIVVKGIIGDKAVTIPVTATAAGSPEANRFNSGGVTGTAYLRDREVAYIQLIRNQSVSSGATFICATPNAITGANFLDVDGNQLQPGDFVKFDGEPESRWVRIASFSGPTQINLASDNGQVPTSTQRPAATGRLVYSKGSYNVVQVQPHYLVPSSTDVYWIAVRRDNGSAIGKAYFRGLELEAGEVRQINDNEPSNLLVYTGAGTEAARFPLYTLADTNGPWQFSENLTVDEVIDGSRQVTFQSAPQLGLQKGDRFVKTVGSTTVIYTVSEVLSGLTVVASTATTFLNPGDTVVYQRVGYSIQDQDNLTLAARKEDRELAKLNTQLSRPVYDESAYVQQINLSGAGVVRSGRYIYTGSISNPTGLAWVMHGTQDVAETIDGQNVVMPGGHPTVGPNAILVHFISGAASFTNGAAVNQIDLSNLSNVATGRTINNPGNPPFLAPTIAGAPSTGVALVLPPNRRTQVLGSGGGYEVWPADGYYKASSVDALSGEDLMVIANDTVRQAVLDYEEVFGGPKGVIRIVRSLPVNTRLRFRSMATYGSVVAQAAGGTSLQVAYNNGSTINTLSGVPVQVNAGDAASGGAGVRVAGAVEVNGDDGGGNIVGGIRPTADRAMNVGRSDRRINQVWTDTSIVKSHNSYTGSEWRQRTASATTTTTSATNVANSAVAMPANSTMHYRATLVAREASDLGQAVIEVVGAFYRAGAGPLVMGSPSTTVVGWANNGSAYAAGFAIVGNDILLVVYGDSTQVYWVANIDYQIVQAAV